MSAYALPGLIFPPMPGCGFESSYVITSSSGESSSSTEKESRPQHTMQHNESPIIASPYQFKPVDFSSMHTSPIAANSPLTPPVRAAPTLFHAEQETDTSSGTSKVGISVKDAKIDAVRLVKSLTTCNSKSRKRETPPPVPQEVKTCKLGKPDTRCKKVSDEDDEDDPHKDAIQFELNISCNGRTYSATRTMPRIIQLRNDLISELSSRRSKALHRMRWIKKRTKAVDLEDETDDDVTVKIVNEDDDDEDGLDQGHGGDDYDDVKIPELPDYYSAEERNSGRGGRGFALLHALLRSYCPVMEGWLLKVTALVPDSPSLSNFLWEPVSGSNSDIMRSTNSFCTLVSIKEDDSEDEDSEEEEVDGAFAF